MRGFLLLILSLAASLALGAAIAAVGLEVLPCRWFGTGVDGACA